MSEWYSKHTKKDLADRIEKLEAKLDASYTRAQIEAAVKRALEGAAAYIAPHPDHDKSDWTDFAWEHDRLARRIRKLDPAQFIEG